MLQPRKGKINFDLADQFVKFGEENKMLIVGYLLVWHSQTARWFFDDEVGNDVSKEVFIERMKTHNHTVISCNQGKVNGRDVVNEAILEDGTYRNSKFYEIVEDD